MENKGKFQKKIEKTALVTIIRLLVIMSTIFVVALVASIVFKSEYEARENLEVMKDLYSKTYLSATNFLQNPQNNDSFIEILDNSDQSDEIQNSLNRYNYSQPISAKMIILDKEDEIVFSSYQDTGDINTIYSHNRAISFNARNLKKNEIYTSVYNKAYGGYPDMMLVHRLSNFNDETIGFVTLILSGEDWSYNMSFFNNDGIITDHNNNVIFFTTPKLLQTPYKFETNDRMTTLSGNRYWTAIEPIDEFNVTMYSFVYYPRNPEVLIGLIVIGLIGFFWYRAAKRMTNAMAEKSASSIRDLVQEIDIIKDHDQLYRIKMETQDEFEEVGDQINNLLNAIQALNDHNTELHLINSQIEMKQLTAQFNPHFLYNSLEILRNLWTIDTQLADDLIHHLTQILRYSVDDSKRDVSLEEDMSYINNYLFIQKLRFGHRFNCYIDIDDDCYSSIVPKLLLQPIIENSIKYGYMKTRSLDIWISGHLHGDELILSVKDNGGGMDTDVEAHVKNTLNKSEVDKNSSGLFNISRRLELKYSGKSGLKIINNQGVGLEIILRIEQSNKEINY